MGNSTFSKEIEGIPSNWNLIEKNYNDKYNGEIKSICEKIKKISDSKDNIVKFVGFVESNSNITLGTLVKLGKACGYLSPCATVVILYFNAMEKDADESIKSFCKSEIATEISGFLSTILQTHLKEALRNIDYNKIEFASDHCSTAIGFVETCYDKGDMTRWFDSIEQSSNGLNMLINILLITKMISDLYLGIVQEDFLEKEKERVEKLIGNLKNLVIESRRKSIVITTNGIPRPVKSATKRNKFSSTIVDKFYNYTHSTRGMEKSDTNKDYYKYKKNVIDKWTQDINNMIKNNDTIIE